MSDCIFCKIIRQEVPSPFVYEDEQVVVIPDIHPKAPVHLLILTRKHDPSLSEMHSDQEQVLGHALMVASHIAQKQGIPSYRIMINTGAEAGQTVFHFHIHLLGGKKFPE
jgi:histidine triad (HIT) family protein